MLSREQFIAAATHLHELEVDSGPLGLGKVWIRELTARQRVDALEGAYLRDAGGAVLTTAEGFSRYDDALYKAFILQASLITGAGGDLVLSLGDVPDLATRGRECLTRLTNEVLNLSWLSKEDLFPRHPEADDRQPDAPHGDRDDDGGAEREGTTDAG